MTPPRQEQGQGKEAGATYTCPPEPPLSEGVGESVGVAGELVGEHDVEWAAERIDPRPQEMWPLQQASEIAPDCRVQMQGLLLLRVARLGQGRAGRGDGHATSELLYENETH